MTCIGGFPGLLPVLAAKLHGRLCRFCATESSLTVFRCRGDAGQQVAEEHGLRVARAEGEAEASICLIASRRAGFMSHGHDENARESIIVIALDIL